MASMADSVEKMFRNWATQCIELKLEDGANIRNEAYKAFEMFAQNQSNVDEILAQLVKTLGPAFGEVSNPYDGPICTTMKSRCIALMVLCGSLQGCTTGQTISLNVVDLLGQFLLPHCGPMHVNNDEVNGENIDEMIRDVSLESLLFLMKSIQLHKPDDNKMRQNYSDAVKMVLDLSRSGVEQRCAVAADEDDCIDGDNVYFEERRHRSGLSLLPRSKRSSCFDLLSAAVDVVGRIGIASSSSQKDTKLGLESVDMIHVQNFIIFVTSCLHGESDPRCLLQLLQLFRTIMECFLPFFQRNISQLFPLNQMFDAIAPYYPIHFTPPPNNPYGITKSKLRNAVVAVLSFTAYDDIIENIAKDCPLTLLNLGIVIILEALVPPEGDEPVTRAEQLDALQDLEIFLFDGGRKSRVSKLSPTEIKELSNTLLIVHDDASNNVSENGINREISKTSKDLVDLCRVVISRIALESERNTTKVYLWETFVRAPVIAITKTLPSSPSDARIALAYIANLCSCGGIKTLRFGLEVGLGRILNQAILSSKNELDVDSLCTAIYAVGAYFSSARTTIGLYKEEGIHPYPHPLHPYTTDAMEKIGKILLEGEQQPLPVRIAALRAIECIVDASPASHFSLELAQQFCTVLRFAYKNLLENDDTSSNLDHNYNERTRKEYVNCGASSFGKYIGMGLSSGESSTESINVERNIFENDPLQFFLRKEVLETMLTRIRNQDRIDSNRTFYRQTMAKACSYSYEVANLIVASLSKALQDSLCDTNYPSTISCCRTLKTLFTGVDGFTAALAYQKLQEPSVTLFHILTMLLPCEDNDTSTIVDSMITKLQLPPSDEERAQQESEISKAEEIVSYLRTAYCDLVDEEHFYQLVQFVSKALPPLSESDNARIRICLPLLSSAMQCCSASKTKSNNNSPNIQIMSKDIIQSILLDLAELSVNAPYRVVRNNAAQCVHAAIADYISVHAECPAKQIVKDIVLVSIHINYRTATGKESNLRQKEEAIEALANGITLLGLLGSAAATRGSTSLDCTEVLVRFLLDLACTKRVAYPFTDITSPTRILDLCVLDEAGKNTSNYLSVSAATALGLMLVSANGSALSIQRLRHCTIRYMSEIVMNNDSTTILDTIGLVTSACNIVCAGVQSTLNKNDSTMLVDLVLMGLSSNSIAALQSAGTDSLKLVLASMIKLLCIFPSSFEDRVYDVVTGAMRAFASTSSTFTIKQTDDADNTTSSSRNIACKLLALQILDIIARVVSINDRLTMLKTCVISVLGVAMNHPSAVIRFAAVEVRNVWYLLN